MNTFKEGDRVSHPNYGEGTVLNPYPGTGYPTVQFDSGEKMMTAEFLLTPVPTKPSFKVGDRVSHRLHGAATVVSMDEDRKLVGIKPDNYPSNRYTQVHPISLTHAEPEQTYHICIEEITGAAHVPGNLTAKEVANYIEHAVNWRVVQEIKITKEGN